ncbi:MAG TPA: hypothetical protein VGK84_07500 [Candidatus Tumulicola sp.]
MLRLALLYSIVFVLFDVAAAAFAKATSVDYGQFVLLSSVLYVFAGILAGRFMQSWLALVPIIIAALVEAFLGGYLAALIGPGGRGPGVSDLSFYGVAAFGVLLNILLGSAGIAVGVHVKRTA